MAKNSCFSINCKGKLLDISKPVVMGILNSTPDSFYNQGREQHPQDLLQLATTMLSEGANLLDLGGMSTRPGAEMISEQEECDRVLPVLEMLHREHPSAILSVDTFRSKVAAWAIQSGASIINDVSGGSLDEAMYSVIAQHQVPYVCMHMQGLPKTMQKDPFYDDVVRDVYAFFQQKLIQLQNLGIHDIILDPGFGFGKTMQHNYQLLSHLDVFETLKAPLMVGVSRKKMVQTPLGIHASEALNGTTVLHSMALMKGASILRVHDVKEAKQCITLYNTMIEASNDD